jgi:hypothetical protein
VADVCSDSWRGRNIIQGQFAHVGRDLSEGTQSPAINAQPSMKGTFYPCIVPTQCDRTSPRRQWKPKMVGVGRTTATEITPPIKPNK